MTRHNLFADDDAVSPVIGVILMVAITVILAAVIGTFVMDLGSNVEANPTAGVTVEGGGSTVTLTSLGPNTAGVYCSEASGNSLADASSTHKATSVGDTMDCSNSDSIIGETDSGNTAVVREL